MNRRRPPTLAIAAAAVVVGCLALTGTAGAKVSCEPGGYRGGVVPLPGLPENPEAGVTYPVAIDLHEGSAVNPEPLLMALRCETSGYARFSDAGSARFSGTTGPGPATRFDVRFPQSGSWRVASMNISGQFRDHGFFTVRPAAADSGSVDDRGGVRPALIGAASIAVLAGLAFAIRRRRGTAPDPSSGA
jgi:hypothetical protein